MNNSIRFQIPFISSQKQPKKLENIQIQNSTYMYTCKYRNLSNAFFLKNSLEVQKTESDTNKVGKSY